MNVIFDIQRIFADKYFVLILFSLRYKSFNCNFYNSYFLLVCGSNIAKKKCPLVNEVVKTLWFSNVNLFLWYELPGRMIVALFFSLFQRPPSQSLTFGPQEDTQSSRSGDPPITPSQSNATSNSSHNADNISESGKPMLPMLHMLQSFHAAVRMSMDVCVV